jgi:hypothetical protein
MSLRIRRGTNAQRTGITFDLGEIVYTTDTQKLYIGDGVTAGGKNLLETSAGNGFTFNQATQQIDFAIGNLNLNTSQVTEDASRLYYTDERAQDAVGAALVAGNAYNTGITFTYNDALNRITAVSTGGLTTVSSDTNPSLGGNLSTGSFNISGNGSISAGTISATTGLGANLSLNTRSITGIGNINITGTVTSTKLVAPTIEGGINGTFVTSDGTTPLSITGIGTLGASSGQVYFNINAAKGTIAAPTTTAAGDFLGGVVIQGYTATGYKAAGLIAAGWDAGATISDNFPKSFISFAAYGGGSNLSTLRIATLNNLGVFNTPVLQTTIYSVATTALPSATTVGKGAKAFVSDATVATFASAYTGGGSNNVPVYSDGTVWRIG